MVPDSSAEGQSLQKTRSQLRLRIGSLWKAVGAWFGRRWTDVRPGPEARRGAVWGSILAALAATVVAGGTVNTGFGLWIDFLFCFVAAGLVVLLSAALIPLLLTIFRKLPRLASGLIFGSILVIALAFMPVGIGAGPIACLSAAMLGASLATILSANFGRSSLAKKIIAVGLLIVSTAAVIGQVVFLAYDGTTEGMVQSQPGKPPPERLKASDPGTPGTFKFRVLTYGTKGENRRRSEFNSPDVATPAVDASKFFEDFKGWNRKLRKLYWGYDMDRLPLNATVWVPEGEGPFPLALIVHGNHEMAEFSDPGYRYLGELLASRGFILASIDENFLNSGLFRDPPKQQAVRGWMLLEHLKLWRDWSRDPRNPIGAAIDFDRIALMGHSRGGEAAATAACFNRLEYYPDDARILFDYHFPIRSIVAIAPADGQYKPAGQWRFIENVNYFTIQGANDADVSSFAGSRQWDRVRYTGGGDWFKSELYIYRANHGQFNTVWGRSDAGYPLGWFLNLKPLLKPDDQRRIARIYISAFLEATLHDRREYVPLFRDYRTIKAWLPETLYVNRFQDAGFKSIAEFSEDPDVTTTTLSGGRISATDLSIWREGRIPFRRGDRDYNGVFIGWNRNDRRGKEDAGIKPAYEITLPGGTALGLKTKGETVLVFSLAVLDEDAPLLGAEAADETDEKKKGETEAGTERETPDFTVELETSEGTTASRPLSDFVTLLPPLKVKFTKLSFLDSLAYEKSSEPVFQTVSIPLAAFGGDHGFETGSLHAIRLRFDRTTSGVILLSKIGIE